MGCCGEPDKAPEQGNRQILDNSNIPVTQQPGPHPGAQYFDKSLPVQTTGTYVQNGYQQAQVYSQAQAQQAWEQHTASLANKANSNLAPSSMGSPSPPVALNEGQNRYSIPPQQSLIRPSPIHASPQRSDATPHVSVSSPQMMPYNPPTQTSVDEGKMSVSIDFGVWFVSSHVSTQT